MCRAIVSTLSLLVAAAAVHAGGPPPMYVVVDKVVLEPNGNAPERIQIWGSFIRTEGKNYEFGKPVEGYVYLSIAPGKESECRAEWAKWKRAVGSHKAVCVGSCGEAGTLLQTAIHKPSERADKPDEIYSPGFLERFGVFYADRNLESQKPVRDLMKFEEQRQASSKSGTNSSRR